MLAILRDVYRTFAGRTLTTSQLVDHLRTHLAADYAEAGLAIGGAEARALVDAWAEQWIAR